MSSTGEITLTFEAPAPLMSMNQKPSRTLTQIKQAWRDTAYFRYIEQFPGKGPSGRALPPSSVFILLPARTRVRRDSSNFQATVKPIVDGITMAGAWPDDTDEFVDQWNPTFYHPAKDDKMLVYVRMVPRT
jgi:hypothetical protein